MTDNDRREAEEVKAAEADVLHKMAGALAALIEATSVLHKQMLALAEFKYKDATALHDSPFAHSPYTARATYATLKREMAEALEESE
jgi:hypothetical protein